MIECNDCKTYESQGGCLTHRLQQIIFQKALQAMISLLMQPALQLKLTERTNGGNT